MTVYLGTAEGQTIIKKAKINKKNRDLEFSNIFYVLLGIIIISGLVYGVVANKVVTMGYDIESIESRLSEMKNENDDLKIRISELRSVKVLENKIMGIGMTEPGNVDYINISREFALKQ